MTNTDLNNLKQHLCEFAEDRDWNQFHSPKNLSMALSVEASEMVEHLTNHRCSNVAGAGRTGAPQWLTEEQSKNLPKEKLVEVETELVDTFIYLIRLADTPGIDLLEVANTKIKHNEEKYPVEKIQVGAKKYAEYE